MRPLTAQIRLDHLRHNCALARALHGGRVLAAVKANGYGHGALACADALADCADGFAVAFLEEALELRAAGVRHPILLLEGVFDAAELAHVDRHDLWMVVHCPEQIAMIEAASPAKPFRVWLKLDSGMHRVGFGPQAYAEAYRRLLASGKVDAVVKITHFARSDESDSPATAAQLECFDRATAGLPGEASVANSAGLMLHPRARRDWGRPGIMLYGASPQSGQGVGSGGLKPVMRLSSRVFAVRELGAGEAIGYGARFVTDVPTRVGLVACGYGDGYPRQAPSGTPVAVDGRAARLIGRVSMDMLTIDLTDLPDSGIGSEVELWGDRVGVNQVAEAAGTLGYELLCNVKRARFVYE
ncbi:alanine racemase [Paludibacterium yongneupense]|uniref:alanine racemase n=1 Tax=Paludibacterium yongneupense TaxID=400061 RepID=UPI00041C8BA4|nr:alanine racemase [Paludibacterium yongneupense]